MHSEDREHTSFNSLFSYTTQSVGCQKKKDGAQDLA